MYDVVYDLGVGSIGCIWVIVGSIFFGLYVVCYDLFVMFLCFLLFYYFFFILFFLGGWWEWMVKMG